MVTVGLLVLLPNVNCISLEHMIVDLCRFDKLDIQASIKSYTKDFEATIMVQILCLSVNDSDHFPAG